ncbi:MAG TPA: mandelate racemase/muconate lactonizing enzyme family protein [Bryobacteraceae bacterium]|jgi:L-alanine-DL-glutamate epimerase-like enolase superfamily enzyme|nr:mandelate racemase/muconate lactonizing enzyme family protein [Bryobacteraceae bacterium]
MKRRDFCKSAAGSALLASQARRAWSASDMASEILEYKKPVFDLHSFFRAPVKIAAIDLLQAHGQYFLRTRSADGAEGIVRTKDIVDYIQILAHRVRPHFLGKDARDLESLVDEVYAVDSNYKLAGQEFWCPVAYIEQSLFDLMGKSLKKPAGEMMGGILRKEIPVYLSGSGRDTTAEEEVEVYVREVERTGAKAVKFKIGGRMSDNRDAYPERTDKLLELAHKKLAGKVTLMADANGSYDAKNGIEIGKRLQEMKYLWFEEPCPWEELSETKAVADALDMKVAFGEQDSSLWLFQWMIDNKVFDVVQPDLNYNGGFIRAARVARMARKANMWICPHDTQTGAATVNILQFAATTRNIGPWMEYVSRKPPKPESWYTPNFDIRNGVIPLPSGPGMGLEFDPDFLKNATVINLV